MTEARKCLIAVCPFDWGTARGMLEGVAAYKELPLHVRENILRFLARTSDPPPRIDSSRIERLERLLSHMQAFLSMFGSSAKLDQWREDIDAALAGEREVGDAP